VSKEIFLTIVNLEKKYFLGTLVTGYTSFLKMSDTNPTNVNTKNWIFLNDLF
jgi:hypothetical protein